MTLPAVLSHDFSKAFSSLLSPASLATLAKNHGPRGAAKPKLSLWQLVMARVYHELARVGNFSASVSEITGVNLSDSALSQRMQSVGHPLFEAILPEVLKPLATEEKHPDAFYNGYHLVAVDGVRFNLKNTEAINERAEKNPCARGSGEPAFAHLRAVVFVELGHHQPLGASLGWQQQGEVTLFRQLIETTPLPKKTLLLGDRLYGSPLLIWELQKHLEKTGSAMLFRIKNNLKVRRKKQYPDGSWLVEVDVSSQKPRRKLGTLKLREITAEIHYEGKEAPLEIRFLTNLLDAETHPANELVELYSMRWEEELFFRELKSHLHKRNNLLDAQTPETAAQEVIALLLAASILATQREAIAEEAGVTVRRISFAKVYHKVATLYEFVATAGELGTEEFLIAFSRKMLKDLSVTAVIKPRPNRSCPRTLRQPVKDWPKTKSASSKVIKKTIIIPNP